MKIRVCGCPSVVKRVYDTVGLLLNKNSKGLKVTFGNYWLKYAKKDDKIFVLAPTCDYPVDVPFKVTRIKDDNSYAVYAKILHAIGADPPVMRVKSLPTVESVNDIWSVINLKGMTAAGKSAVAFSLIEDAYRWRLEVYWVKDSRGNLHTYLPEKNMVILGTYSKGTGGCDTFTKEDVMTALRELWPKRVNILYEGVIVSDTVATYKLYCDDLSKEYWNTVNRRQVYVFLHATVKTIKQRLTVRNFTGKLNITYLNRKWNKFKYMPMLYEGWSQVDSNVRNIFIDTETYGVEHAKQRFLDILNRRLVEVESDLHSVLPHYKKFVRKDGRTPEQVLELSRIRSEKEDMRIHGRKIKC